MDFFHALAGAKAGAAPFGKISQGKIARQFAFEARAGAPTIDAIVSPTNLVDALGAGVSFFGLWNIFVTECLGLEGGFGRFWQIVGQHVALRERIENDLLHPVGLRSRKQSRCLGQTLLDLARRDEYLCPQRRHPRDPIGISVLPVNRFSFNQICEHLFWLLSGPRDGFLTASIVRPERLDKLERSFVFFGSTLPKTHQHITKAVIVLGPQGGQSVAARGNGIPPQFHGDMPTKQCGPVRAHGLSLFVSAQKAARAACIGYAAFSHRPPTQSERLVETCW